MPEQYRSAFSLWYTTKRWRRRRAAQLREHPLCKRCLEQGIVVSAKVVDHVIPHRGDINSFWLGELQSLCQSCHSSAKQAQEARGYALDVGLDGWPTDPKHPANQHGKQS